MNISTSSRPSVSERGNLRGFMSRHPLVSYFLMAYGFSWLAWLPIVLSQDGLGLLPIHLSDAWGLLGVFGPLLSAVLVAATISGKIGIRHLLRQLFLWRVGWQWYLFIFLGVPGLLMLGTLASPQLAAALQVPTPQLVLALLPALVFQFLAVGFGEEPGWRGFALPRLQQRYGPLGGTLILGVLWGGWHLPWSLTDSGAAGTSSGATLLTMGGIILSVTSVAIVMTWVFNRTQGNVLISGMLLHAMLNAFADVGLTSFFPPQLVAEAAPLPLLIGFGVASLLLISVTRGRLGYRRASSPPDHKSVLWFPDAKRQEAHKARHN
jgi:membrane protease YdiL (CAAX protease family)